MTKIGRVALFRGEGEEYKQLTTLFSRHEYALRIVDTIDDVLSLSQEEGSCFDVIALTVSLAGGESGISTCLSLKAQPALAPIPVLAMMFTKDTATLEAFFSYGADVVMIAPFNPDLLYFQIGAMARQKRAYDEQIEIACNTAGLQAPAISALNCAREGLLLLDDQQQPFFVNKAAEMLLGLEAGLPAAALGEKLETSWLQELLLSAKKAGPGGYAFKRRISRLDGQSFNALGRIVPLGGAGGRPCAYAVGMTDGGDLERLSGMLLQGQHLRSIALIAAAAGLKLLADAYSQIPVSALSKLEEMLLEEPERCELNPTVQALLEIVDLLINPGINFKVDLKQECFLAIRRADLLQMLGHTVLYAVDQAGLDGEISLSTQTPDTSGGLTMIIAAHSKRPTPLVPDDHLHKLMSGQALVESQQTARILRGLEAAQAVADRYGITIEFKSSPATIKIRLKLPLIR